MKTDPLFYELFQTYPHIFFEIAQILPSCPYRFESITVKATEKRIDGVLEPTVEKQPIYFVEVQASPDQQIYWRVLRESSTYFEQRPSLKDNEWSAYVIWLDKKDDRGFKESVIYNEQKKQRIFSIDLIGVLKKLSANSLALNVLKPLIVDNEEEVRQNIVSWIEQIHAADLSADVEQRLVMLMAQLIEEKFKILSYKELCKMLNLTPFRETTSYKETFFEDLQKEFSEMLIQMIEAKFKFSKRTITKLVLRLRQLTLDDLKAMFKEIIVMKRLKEINAWIDSRLPPQQNEPSQLANLPH